jgi:hypothetical protein
MQTTLFSTSCPDLPTSESHRIHRELAFESLIQIWITVQVQNESESKEGIVLHHYLILQRTTHLHPHGQL